MEATRDTPDTDVRLRRAGAPPATRVSLSRVGVTGVEKIIRISANGDEQLYHAALECYVDLNPLQAGVHMSRFEEIVNEAVDEVVIGEALKAETLAAHIAERVRERQDGLRAEVTIRARYPEHKQTPGFRADDPGALHVDRDRGRLRAGDAAPGRSRGAGHDRLPMRAGAGRGRGARAARGAGLHRRRDRARLRLGPGRDPQPAGDRQPLRGLPRGLRRRAAGPRRCCASSRSR